MFLFFPGNTEVVNEIEENQYNLEKKSTEGMDQLKKKINELQSVSMESVFHKIAHQCEVIALAQQLCISVILVVLFVCLN